LIPFIPAGTQIKKTVQGLTDVSKGYSETQSGKVKYPVEQNTGQYIKGGLFGRHNLPEAQEYYKEERSPLGENQSELFKSATDRFAAYGTIMENRAQTKAETEAKARVQESGAGEAIGKKYFYLDDNGEVKSVQTDRKIEKPKLTGETELDKKLVSKYNSSITAKINDITTLYEQGQMPAGEAEKKIRELTQMKISTKKPKKFTFKKIKMKKVAVPKIKKIKVKKTTTKVQRTAKIVTKITTPKINLGAKV